MELIEKIKSIGRIGITLTALVLPLEQTGCHKERPQKTLVKGPPQTTQPQKLTAQKDLEKTVYEEEQEVCNFVKGLTGKIPESFVRYEGHVEASVMITYHDPTLKISNKKRTKGSPKAGKGRWVWVDYNSKGGISAHTEDFDEENQIREGKIEFPERKSGIFFEYPYKKQKVVIRLLTQNYMITYLKTKDEWTRSYIKIGHIKDYTLRNKIIWWDYRDNPTANNIYATPVTLEHTNPKHIKKLLDLSERLRKTYPIKLQNKGD